MALYCSSVSSQAGELAYSAHDYGPFVAPLFWFYNETFYCTVFSVLSVCAQAGKLAYSAHDYGPCRGTPSLVLQRDLPRQPHPLMRKNWGRVIEKGIGPVWVGEFGSFYPPNTSDLNYRERATFEQQIKYIGQV